VPTSTRNSLTKLDSPGSARLDRPATRKVPASIGATRWTPPKSAISRDPRRLIRNPAMRNSAAVEKPWLTMYSVEPDCPWVVIAKMPRTMNPKWLIEV
jgi:hypothetical protein